MSFIFSPKKGETPEEVKRRRELAKFLLAQASRPARDIPSGISALGAGLASAIHGWRANQGQAVIDQNRSSMMGDLMGAMTPGNVTPPVTPDAAAAAPPNKNLASALRQDKPSGDKQSFIDEMMPAAIEQGKRTGVDPRIIIAQAAQETGWGKSAPGNNYFGIKSHGKGGGQNLATHEVINGKRVKVNDNFRQYDSPADSARGYGDFILENPRYGPLRNAKGLDAQLAALQASGYATDPNYASSVGSIARSIDVPSGVTPQMPPGLPQPVDALPNVQPPAPIDTAGAVDPEPYLRGPFTAKAAQAGLADRYGVDAQALPGGRIQASAAAAQPDQLPPPVGVAGGPQPGITPTAATAPPAGALPPQADIPPRLMGMRAFDEDYQGIGSVPNSMRNMVPQGAPPMQSAPGVVAPPSPPMQSAPGGGMPPPMLPDNAGGRGMPPGLGASMPPQGGAGVPDQQAMLPPPPPQGPAEVPQRGTARDRAIMQKSLPIIMAPKGTFDPAQVQFATQAYKMAYENSRPLTKKEKYEAQMARIKMGTAQLTQRKTEKELAGTMPPTQYQQQQSELANKRFEFDKEKSAKTNTIREFEAFQAMTPEEQTQFLKMKKSGASSTNIDLGESGFTKEFSKLMAKRADRIFEGAINARSKISKLQTLATALSKSETGFGAETTLKVKKLGAFLGWNIDVADEELAQAVGNGLALELRNPSGGAGMPGAMSDKDREFLENSIPNLQKTPGGNAKLAEYMIKVEERSIEVSRMTQKYMNENNGTLDYRFFKDLDQWSKANPLFPDAPSTTGAPIGGTTKSGVQWRYE